MNFIKPDLESFLIALDGLTNQHTAKWGDMTPQRMIEHLSNSIKLSIGDIKMELEIPKDKIQKAQDFIASEHPMPKNFKASYVVENEALRNENLELAIDELACLWVDFELLYSENENLKNSHPNFGELNFKQWLKLHSKHFNHHFEQFGLI